MKTKLEEQMQEIERYISELKEQHKEKEYQEDIERLKRLAEQTAGPKIYFLKMSYPLSQWPYAKH
jgi:hypothetical protein